MILQGQNYFFPSKHILWTKFVFLNLYAYFAYYCNTGCVRNVLRRDLRIFWLYRMFHTLLMQIDYTIILTIINDLKLFQTIPVKVLRRERTVLRKLRWPPVFAYYSFMFVIHARISLFFLIWFFKHVISSGACTGYQLEGVQPCKVLKFLQLLMKCYWRETIISKEKRILDCKFLIQPLLHVPEPGFRKNKK